MPICRQTAASHIAKCENKGIDRSVINLEILMLSCQTLSSIILRNTSKHGTSLSPFSKSIHVPLVLQCAAMTLTPLFKGLCMYLRIWHWYDVTVTFSNVEDSQRTDRPSLRRWYVLSPCVTTTPYLAQTSCHKMDRIELIDRPSQKNESVTNEIITHDCQG